MVIWQGDRPSRVPPGRIPDGRSYGFPGVDGYAIVEAGGFPFVQDFGKCLRGDDVVVVIAGGQFQANGRGQLAEPVGDGVYEEVIVPLQRRAGGDDALEERGALLEGVDCK